MNLTVIYLIVHADGVIIRGGDGRPPRFSDPAVSDIQKRTSLIRWINPGRIFSGPDRRTRLTAEFFSSIYEVPPILVDSLKAPKGTGAFIGKKGWYRSDNSARMKKSFECCQKRIKETLDTLFDAHSGKRILVCLNPTLLSLYLNTITPSFDEKRYRSISPLDFFRVIRTTDAWILRG